MTYNLSALAAMAKGDLDNFLVAATPGGIEAQESAGQAELVSSTDMPIELRPSRQDFEKVGFKFGDVIDELFISATLPDGWRRRSSDHSMWSYIVDEKGRDRVSVFYKAAFYDRKAAANLKGRFAISTRFPGEAGSGLEEGQIATVLLDGGKEVRRFGVTGEQDWGAEKEIRATANKWLRENYPDWLSVTAYWD